MVYYAPPGSNLTKYDFGFYIYKEGEAKRRTFSWNVEIAIVAAADERTPRVFFVNGTSIWFDPTNLDPCHPGEL
jgi:hypothetical protein